MKTSLKVDFELTIPEKFEVKVETAKGDIKIEALNGNVKAKSNEGDIKIDKVKKGDVNVETKRGNLSVDDVGEGFCRAVTMKGNISVGKTSGNLKVEAKDGSISVGQGGGEIHAETYNHTILVGECAGQLHVETGGGDCAVKKDKHRQNDDILIHALLQICLPIYCSARGAATAGFSLFLPLVPVITRTEAVVPTRR